VFVTIATLAVLALISVRANDVWSAHSHLPMQFGLNGQVGWSARRVVALSVSPILAVLIMVPIVFFPAQRFILPFVGFCMIGGHLFHLWLIQKHLKG